MKKYLMLSIAILLSLSLFSCNKKIKKDKFYSEFEKRYSKIDEYSVDFVLTIMGEDDIKFNGSVNYLKDDFFKVTLINESNNNKQVILKNKSGVYVLTPALNKSFKFPSSWPNNSTHSYLLCSIRNDIINDNEKEITEDDNGFIVDAKIDSKSDGSLSRQRIIFDKETLMPKDVYIYDSNMNLRMTVNFSNYNFKTNFNESMFNEEANMTGLLLELGEGFISYEIEFSAPVSINYDVDVLKSVYDNGCVWYYNGEINFTLVEENISSDSIYNPYTVYDEPILLNNGVGAYSNSKLIWYNNGIEYKIYSDSLTISEMVKIANMI